MESKLLVLRLDHIFAGWPTAANLSVLRVSTPDFELFAEQCRGKFRRPLFMRAPVEHAPELRPGRGVAGFDSGETRYIQIEWSEL